MHKGHPHPWRDGAQLDRICQILLLWKHEILRGSKFTRKFDYNRREFS
jgi:hypothetical protein